MEIYKQFSHSFEKQNQTNKLHSHEIRNILEEMGTQDTSMFKIVQQVVTQTKKEQDRIDIFFSPAKKGTRQNELEIDQVSDSLNTYFERIKSITKDNDLITESQNSVNELLNEYKNGVNETKLDFLRLHLKTFLLKTESYTLNKLEGNIKIEGVFFSY